MKITGLQTHLVRLPGAPTLADIPDKADQYTFVTLQLRTDEGVEGIGITFFGAALAATLKSAVDQLGALTVGEDPLRPEAVVEKLRGAAKGAGPGGIFTLALHRHRHRAVGHQGQGARTSRCGSSSAASATACRPTRAAR